MPKRRLQFGTRRKSALLAINLWIVIILPVPATAQALLSEANSTAGSEEPPSEKISPDAGPEDDRAIERRLRDVVSKIEGLEGIKVEVAAGVVTLQGEALSTEARKEAEKLAERIEGVVAVNNEINEIRDVERRLEPTLDKIVSRIYAFVTYLPVLTVALVIVFLFWLVAKFVGGWKWLFGRVTPNRFLRDLLRQAVRGIVLLIGVVLALDFLGATAVVGAVLGAAGLLGLAVSFAFRDTMENYIASILLSIRQPFAPNDHVVIEGYEGHVIRLTSRATILLTFEGSYVSIPNATVFKGIVVNYTRNPKRRFDFVVGVGTGEDLTEVQKLALDTLGATEGVLDDPPPLCLIEALGNFNVTLRMLGWVDQRSTDYGKVKGQAIRQVKQAFDNVEIVMPEPTYRLHLQRLQSEPGVTKAESIKKPEAANLTKHEREFVEHDVARQHELERVIESERAKPGEKDLLDPPATKG
jgi:small conductance mechanosensitive channel